jgi:hypothetical protein
MYTRADVYSYALLEEFLERIRPELMMKTPDKYRVKLPMWTNIAEQYKRHFDY